MEYEVRSIEYKVLGTLYTVLCTSYFVRVTSYFLLRMLLSFVRHNDSFQGRTTSIVDYQANHDHVEAYPEEVGYH